MKKIAILTSGGDSSSMNKCITSILNFASKSNIEVFFVFDGYKGLYENKIYPSSNFVDTYNWCNLPGTKIFTSRFIEFKEDKYVQIAADNLKKLNIHHLIVIGGDGSYMGAYKLHNKSINVYCLPGTIDNDITSTKYTIGFDTSLNTIVDCIFKIKACMTSHNNIAFIEIMGRKCIDLTVFAGIATEADILITQQNLITPTELLYKINQIKKAKQKRGMIILITENLLGKNNVPSINEYKQYIQENSQFEVKINVLGHMQRGGNPTAMDLVRTTQMAYKAIECINNNLPSKIIGLDHQEEPVCLDLEVNVNNKEPINRVDWINKYI